MPKHKEVSKFPEVRRDLAFFVDNSVLAADLIAVAKDAAGADLINLKLFDVYHSKDVDNKGKSLALGLTFQHSSRTLSDDEITSAVNRVIETVGGQFNAQLRS